MSNNNKSKLRVASIVPAYNEQDTIGDVIHALKQSKLVNEVIVVSDGSTDETAKRALLSGADKVIENSINLGKAESMEIGVRATRAPIILFCDADLIGFKVGHIENIVKPVVANECVMCIGLRDRSWLYRIIGKYLPRISGERAVRRDIFENIPKQLKKGFSIESAMNYYCLVNKLKVKTIALDGLNMRKKYEKVSLIIAIFEYVNMAKQVVFGYIHVLLLRFTNKI